MSKKQKTQVIHSNTKLRPAVREEAGLFHSQLPAEEVIGKVSFANGEKQEFTNVTEYLKCIRAELPDHPVTGFRYETLTTDPVVRKAVDDELYNLYGEENPRGLEDYIKSAQGKMTMGGLT